jgi:dCMP deaminase
MSTNTRSKDEADAAAKTKIMEGQLEAALEAALAAVQLAVQSLGTATYVYRARLVDAYPRELHGGTIEVAGRERGDFFASSVTHCRISPATVLGYLALPAEEVPLHLATMQDDNTPLGKVCRALLSSRLSMGDQDFLDAAEAEAAKSSDPDTGIGCVIVDPSGKTLGAGCNAQPPILMLAVPQSRVLQDIHYLKDGKTSEARSNKYPYTCHAESNALHDALLHGHNLSGSTLYVTGLPCEPCCLEIVRAGIRRVVVGTPKTSEGSIVTTDRPVTYHMLAAASILLTLDGRDVELELMRFPEMAPPDGKPCKKGAPE